MQIRSFGNSIRCFKSERGVHHPLAANATRRNHFSTILQLFSQKSHKNILKQLFSIFCHAEGNFDIDAGDGGGGGPFKTKNQQKLTRKLKKRKSTQNITNKTNKH